MSDNLKLIDRERNFMLEAAIQEDSRVVFVMTNGDHHPHRWMMRADLNTAREQLTAFLAGLPGARDDLGTIRTLKERVWLLEEALCELLIYASPTPKSAKQASDLCKDGYTSELVPRFTRIGSVLVADRVEAIRKLVATEKQGAT
jgi:hypothetical protein